jgi:NitT/TauT family transport system substrate-binding protein
VVGLTGHSAIQWAYFIAADQGFYKDANLDVSFVEANSNATAVQGLISGSLNIGGGSPSALVQAYANGAKNLVVTGAAVERPIYTLAADKSIQSIAGLKGKRVGVSAIKSTDGLWMRQILQSNGLNPDKDVQIVQIGGARLQALTTGGVAATFLPQPDDFAAIARGYKSLAKSTDVAKQITWESYSTTREWATANADVLVRFLAAQRRAAAWFYDPANSAAAAEILVKNAKAKPEDAKATYDFFIAEGVLTQKGEATELGVQANIDAAKANGRLSAPVTAADVMDGSYMERAARLVP